VPPVWVFKVTAGIQCYRVDKSSSHISGEELVLLLLPAVVWLLHAKHFVLWNQKLWFRISTAVPLEQHCPSYSLFQLSLDNLNFLCFTIKYPCMVCNVSFWSNCFCQHDTALIRYYSLCRRWSDRQTDRRTDGRMVGWPLDVLLRNNGIVVRRKKRKKALCILTYLNKIRRMCVFRKNL
jgi:hypothetical protein